MSGGKIRIVASPFDKIRRVDDDGIEYWSGRELMPPLGYGADWRNFSASVDRARVTAANTGQDVETLFVGVTEKTGGRPREDVRLSRYAAYLVAMNCDPRKPEVAAAQAYFAIQTRKAEIAESENDWRLQLPQTLSEALFAYAREVQAREAAEAHAKELEPKAEIYDMVMSIDGTYSIGEVGKLFRITQNNMFKKMRDAGILCRDKARWNTPTVKYDPYFPVRTTIREDTYGNIHRDNVTRAYPEAIPLIIQVLGLTVTREIEA